MDIFDTESLCNSSSYVTGEDLESDFIFDGLPDPFHYARMNDVPVIHNPGPPPGIAPMSSHPVPDCSIPVPKPFDISQTQVLVPQPFSFVPGTNQVNLSGSSAPYLGQLSIDLTPNPFNLPNVDPAATITSPVPVAGPSTSAKRHFLAFSPSDFTSPNKAPRRALTQTAARKPPSAKTKSRPRKGRATRVTKSMEDFKPGDIRDGLADSVSDVINNNKLTLTKLRLASPTKWLVIRTAGRAAFLALMPTVFATFSDDCIDQLIENARRTLIPQYPEQRFGT
jgi:hypothetical protein